MMIITKTKILNCALTVWLISSSGAAIAAVTQVQHLVGDGFELMFFQFDRTPACLFLYDRVAGRGELSGLGAGGRIILPPAESTLIKSFDADSTGRVAVVFSREVQCDLFFITNPLILVIQVSPGETTMARLPFEPTRRIYLERALAAEVRGESETARRYAARAAEISGRPAGEGIIYFAADNPFAWAISEVISLASSGDSAAALKIWSKRFTPHLLNVSDKPGREEPIGDSILSAVPAIEARAEWRLFDLSGERYKYFGAALMVIGLAAAALLALAGHSGWSSGTSESEITPLANHIGDVRELPGVDEPRLFSIHETKTSPTSGNDNSVEISERILARQRDGADVETIARELGISQDEVQLALNLARLEREK